jgi:hypothetical protein
MENRTTVLAKPEPLTATAVAEPDTSRLVKVLFLGRRFHVAPGPSIAEICNAAGVDVTPSHTVRLNQNIVPNEQTGSTVTRAGDFLVVVPNLKNG